MEVAFLFDNDGVLVDTTEYHWQAWRKLMEDVPEIKMDYQGFIGGFGKRNDLILKEIVPDVPEKTRKEWADRKEELFRESAHGQIQLLPGMEAFLKQVVDKKIPHIIASSTPVPNLEMFLNQTVLGKYFEHYVSAENVGHGKPAPDIFIAAAEKLGFDPKDCIVFEDAPVGIQAGKAAGSFVVALATSHKQEQLSGYDMIYPSPKELNLDEILNAFAA